MSRCQHCHKLTHSEDLVVYFDNKDFEKITELECLAHWTSRWSYGAREFDSAPASEYGKLKCGDIYIHFVASEESNIRQREVIGG